ncbi:MAG: exodeoxyribonuclease VII large subunit [Acidiferrobacteraceae bacterium]|jgi:exodeoxyribonuclease VII large subunit
MSTAAPAPPDLYTVSRLAREVKALLESGFGTILLEGEISNLARPASGHLYFSLKDDKAQIRCAFFRGAQRGLAARPEDGMQVLVRARVSLYEARGDFQLIVEHLEPAGEGALRQAFDALKSRLAAENLFAPEHKRTLPTLPHRIGIITSPSGAVVHDILTTLRRRFPAIPVLIYPVPVQGEGAAEQIANMIHLADDRGECDALILARGGGSLEDLWAFNEEVVARAIFACRIPLVCGVGHETDFTIADLVADARAPTPTAAAEMLSPHREAWAALYTQHGRRIERLMDDRLNSARQQLDGLARRLVHPRQRLQVLAARLQELHRRLQLAVRNELVLARAREQELSARLRRSGLPDRIARQGEALRHRFEGMHAAMERALDRAANRLQEQLTRLNALSPLATLQRGFAVVRSLPGREIVHDAGSVTRGDKVETLLGRGRLVCKVEETHEEDR